MAGQVAAASPSEAVAAIGTGDVHEVVPGDTLWDIARGVLAKTVDEPTSIDVAHFWPRIYAANRAVIGEDPDLILPGQILVIPEG